MADAFHDRMIAALPKLRVQAMALCRRRSLADDLVQEAVAKALSARDSFDADTNFEAWMHRILRNTFISWLRRQRETEALEDSPAERIGIQGGAFDHLVLRELGAALGRLSPGQRSALVMVTVQGYSYEQVAAATGVSVGTAKCRVFRARRLLRTMLLGEELAPAATEMPRDRKVAGWIDPAVRAIVRVGSPGRTRDPQAKATRLRAG